MYGTDQPALSEQGMAQLSKHSNRLPKILGDGKKNN